MMSGDLIRSTQERTLMDVVGKMREFTSKSITQICGNLNHNTGELVGTGSFLRIRGQDYLLTAQHVAHKQIERQSDGSRKYPEGLSHSVGSDHLMMNILNPWITLDLPKDIAVTSLSPAVLQGTDRDPLSVDNIALNTESMSGNDLYFIHGFPGNQSRFSAFFGRGVMSTSLPYGCVLGESNWPVFDPQLHFAITYPCCDLIDERGEATNLPHPRGLSGSVVWKTNREGSPEGSWSPEMARVVGVAHRFDQESQSLVVTRIEYVKGLLLYMLRSDFAYLRWLNRGKPLWDDLEDWVAAEQAIRDLRG